MPKNQTALKDTSDSIEQYRSVIEEKNDDMNAFLEVFEPREPASGTLDGMPLAVKDNILINGRTASAASRMLENYIATFDATAISRLRDAGAWFLGRTNMDEFAMGSSTENSAFGPTKNPAAGSRVPGGSSGGSAAAVAAGMCQAALGSDTGGSIRQPASFCGVVGLKPSYGAVSRSGLIAMGSSLDQIGPITTTIADAKAIFEVIRGVDPLDSTTLPDERWQNAPSKEVQTVGVPWGLIRRDGVDQSVIENTEASIEHLKGLGYTVVDIELSKLAHALAAYYIIMPAEVSSNLSRFDGVRYGLHVDGEDVNDEYQRTRGDGFGDEVRRRIMLGTYVLSSGYYDAYYRRARHLRSVIRAELARAFEEVDVVMTPTTPTPPFKLGEFSEDPLAMSMADLFTVPANIAGNPAISVPSGEVEEEGERLPLGMQFTAPICGEERLFTISASFIGEN